MRFGYVLLGLVTLTSIHISSGQCSNGLAGVQNGDVCCDEGCGTCGGSGCARRPGGSSACCIGPITRSDMMCSDTQAAPCIIEAEDMCSNGLPGTQSDDVCCAPGCGECGGSGCGTRPGGSADCCANTIRSSGVMCSTSSASPCIIDDENVCSNGVPGVERGGICCEAQCGTCGGSGCSRRPGGKDSCCSSTIDDSGIACNATMVAPCII